LPIKCHRPKLSITLSLHTNVNRCVVIPYLPRTESLVLRRRRTLFTPPFEARCSHKNTTEQNWSTRFNATACPRNVSKMALIATMVHRSASSAHPQVRKMERQEESQNRSPAPTSATLAPGSIVKSNPSSTCTSGRVG
jgi:hypothetical protein